MREINLNEIFHRELIVSIPSRQQINESSPRIIRTRLKSVQQQQQRRRRRRRRIARGEDDEISATAAVKRPANWENPENLIFQFVKGFPFVEGVDRPAGVPFLLTISDCLLLSVCFPLFPLPSIGSYGENVFGFVKFGRSPSPHDGFGGGHLNFSFTGFAAVDGFSPFNNFSGFSYLIRTFCADPNDADVNFTSAL